MLSCFSFPGHFHQAWRSFSEHTQGSGSQGWHFPQIARPLTWALRVLSSVLCKYASSHVSWISAQPCTGCRIPQGFWEYYRSLQSCVLTSVQSLKSSYSTSQISVTGHSLGAAAASLCALDLQTKSMKPTNTYTFGNFGHFVVKFRWNFAKRRKHLLSHWVQESLELATPNSRLS